MTRVNPCKLNEPNLLWIYQPPAICGRPEKTEVVAWPIRSVNWCCRTRTALESEGKEGTSRLWALWGGYFSSYSCTFSLKVIQGYVKTSAFHTYLIFPNYDSTQWQADWNSYDPCCSCFAGFLYLHKHFLSCFLILPQCPIMASYYSFFTISFTRVQIVFHWWQLCLWYFLL